MKTLVNQNIEHIKFGKGKVVSEENSRIDIAFENDLGQKSFLYPDSFEKFLKLKNEALQNECFELAVKKREAIANEAEELRLEQVRIAQELVDEENLKKLEAAKKKRGKAKVDTTAKI